MNLEEANTYKQSHQILKRLTAEGWDASKMIIRTFGFIEGYESRQEEVSLLKRQVNELSNCPCFSEVDQLKAEVEELKKEINSRDLGICDMMNRLEREESK